MHLVSLWIWVELVVKMPRLVAVRGCNLQFSKYPWSIRNPRLTSSRQERSTTTEMNLQLLTTSLNHVVEPRKMRLMGLPNMC